MSLYCSQRHENPLGSRFCHLCGEKLPDTAIGGVYSGLVLGDRYRVTQELGHGGFGRTYLATDQNRFNEPCVLKEFAPQVSGTYALQKAEELFEREAGILYKLQHPQIPRFRELFRAKIADQTRLFLVQDYVAGQTYRALLETRRQQGQFFSEAEITQLLQQLLPVLEYIHSLGVVHRDISPDNLILRSSDYLPVLIDFGGVKQVAATVASQVMAQPLNAVSSPTRLGKIGYAPDEQLQVGVAYPHSDLYALGMTVLVLLTGREPAELIDSYTLTRNWRQYVTLSPRLSAIVDRMVAQRPGDRYPSAREVLQALSTQEAPPFSAQTVAPAETHMPTVAIAPPTPPSYAPPTPPSYTPPAPPHSVPSRPTVAAMSHVPEPRPAKAGGFGQVMLVLVVMLGAAGLGWWASQGWFNSLADRNPSEPTSSPTATVDTEPSPDPQFSQEEQNRKQALGDRRRALGVDYQFFVRLIDQAFYAENSDLQGRQLSDGPEDANWRAQWDEVANQVLSQLESLSPEARGRLGQYSKADRDRWNTIVNKQYLSSRALYTLADAQFFRLFPQQQGQNFTNQPIGQVWHAIADDEVRAIQAGTALEKIQFDKGAFSQQVSGSLAAGEGKAYIASLSEGQFIRMNLQAGAKTLLSIYPPTSSRPALLDNSEQTSWSGRLDQTGYYEFVVVAPSESVSYQLDIAADNVTSTPPSSLPTDPTPEPSPPAPSPEPTPEPTPPSP